jgi:GGDEF domain-containing protein
VLHDPLTGLPGHALLLDRLEQSLIRARTRGTLVTLVLVTAPDSLLEAARVLRQNLRPDFTVARYRDTVLAVLAEHDFGDGSPISSLIRQLVGDGPQIHWVTSDGDTTPDDVLATAEQH